MSVRPGATLFKDPSAVLEYEMDWDDWLSATATIASSSWTISGPDAILTQSNAAIASDSRSATVLLTAGTVNKTYTVTNRITTNESPAQTDERSFLLKIQQR